MAQRSMRERGGTDPRPKLLDLAKSYRTKRVKKRGVEKRSSEVGLDSSTVT